ncbi:MAG: PAS domain S-box protein [Gemmatimonadota bacterium]
MLPPDLRDRTTPPDLGEIEGLDTLLEGLEPADGERVRRIINRGRRHEARLQLLQQIAASLARTLDEDEILEELSRGVRRAVVSEGVVVALVDLDRALVDVVHHVVGELVRPLRVLPLGTGPLGEAARTGETVHVAPYDPATSTLAASDDVLMGLPRSGSVLAVPMMHGRRLLGVVALHDPRDDAFDGDAREVIGMLVRHAAAALSNARLFAESERERRQSEAMAEIARAVGESLKMGEVLRLILRHGMALLQAEGACVALREGDYLHVVSALGIAELLSGVHMPIAGSLSGRVVTTGLGVVTNDIAAEPDAHRSTVRLLPLQRSVIVPLMTARGILGSIAVYNRPTEFTADDARVLQRLADQVAVAVVNARLYEEVRDATREWSAAFDSIGVGMCLVDDAGLITRSNSRALQLTIDGTLRILMGRPFYQTVLGSLPEDGGDPLTRAIEDGVQSRTVCEGANGRWLDILAVPHPNGGAIVTFDDVSSQRAVWDRHRLMIESAADPICTLDREGRLIFANPAARALFGRDDLTGAHWSELVLHEMADEARVHVQLAAVEGVQRHEYVVVRSDGERRVVAVALSPVTERDHVAMVVASMHDVTDERRARDAVSHAEARYRQLFDTASDAVVTLSLTGAITSANSAACDVFDTPGDQLLGRSFHPFLAPSDLDRLTTFLRDTWHGEARRTECTIVRRTGMSRTLALTVTPIQQGRAVIGLLLVARDVTDERGRVDVLHRSEARYAQLVDTASDAIFTVDEEGSFTSINRSFEAATGHGRDAISGHHFTELLDPRDREAIWELFVTALHGQRVQREVRYLDASGHSRWGSLVASPIVEGGRVTGVMGMVRDVSAEKRMLDELLRRERLASVGQWLGGVAHELNNPLSAILAFSELLLEAPAGEGGDRETLVTLHQEAGRAAGIISNLMHLTRDRPSERRELQLADAVDQALAIRRYALGVAGIELHADIRRDLPTTVGDAGRLQQAVLHLVSRAEHALRGWSGVKRLSVRLSRVANALVLEVQDSGPGIASSELDRLFTPGVAARDGADLAGIGLAVAAGIVREHGGRVHVDSTPGDGATFVVEIPIVISPEFPVAVSRSEERVAHIGSLDVLVVDDEPAIRQALSQLLERLGHRVRLAQDGEEARGIIEERTPDRILLDLRMPRMGGDALFDELRERHPAVSRGVIFLTGDVESESAAEYLRSSGCLTLHKPFTLEAVREAIDATAPPG